MNKTISHKICIDNKFNLITSYYNGVESKKFSLIQLKAIWLCVEAVNKKILDYKFDITQNRKDYKISDVIFNGDLRDHIIKDYIYIDKNEFKKRCFGYRISDSNLRKLIKQTNMSFENKYNNSFCNLFQGGKIDDDNIIFLPTIYIAKLLHCEEKHYSIDVEEILKFKSVNTIIFYQLYQSSKYIIDEYKKDLIFDIEKLKQIFSFFGHIRDFSRKVLEPSINDYNKIYNTKIKIQPIKDGKTITSIKFYR